MNLGAIIALLKLAQDSGLTPRPEKPTFFGRDKKVRDSDFVSIVVRPVYDVTTGLRRAREGLGL
jgi:hypothetical protein